MALVALPIPILWPSPTELALQSATMDIIDAASESAGLVFKAPDTGSLTDIGFGMSPVTTGATVDVRLETVSLAEGNGNPTGALFGLNTNASKVIAGTDDHKWLTATLTAAASVTIGDNMAIQIVNPATSFGNMEFFGTIPFIQDSAHPYTAAFLNAAWVKRSRGGSYAVKIGGVWYNVGGLAPWCVVAGGTITTGALEAGNKIVVPFKCQVNGFKAAAVNWAGIDSVGTLYSSDGTTVLRQSTTYDKDVKSSASGQPQTFVFAPVALNAGDTVYACVSTAGASITLFGLQTNVNANMTGLVSGGANIYKVARAAVGSGAFTETNTDRLSIMLCLNQIDNGAGGGGLLVHPGMTGGLHG